MIFDEKFKSEQEIITGEQSAITPRVLDLCEKIPGEGKQLIHNIVDYIHSLNFVQTEKPDFSRTADEIIQSNFNLGCHESGVVFVTI